MSSLFDPTEAQRLTRARQGLLGSQVYTTPSGDSMNHLIAAEKSALMKQYFYGDQAGQDAELKKVMEDEGETFKYAKDLLYNSEYKHELQAIHGAGVTGIQSLSEHLGSLAKQRAQDIKLQSMIDPLVAQKIAKKAGGAGSLWA